MGAATSTPNNEQEFRLWVVEPDAVIIRPEDQALDGELRAVINDWLKAPKSADSRVRWHYPLVNLLRSTDQAGTHSVAAPGTPAWLVVIRSDDAKAECDSHRVIVDFNHNDERDWTVSRLVSAFCTPCDRKLSRQHPTEEVKEGNVSVNGTLVRRRLDNLQQQQQPPRKQRRLTNGRQVWVKNGDDVEWMGEVHPLRAFFGQHLWQEVYATDLRNETHQHLTNWDQRNLLLANNAREELLATDSGWRIKLERVKDFVAATTQNPMWNISNIVINMSHRTHQIFTPHTSTSALLEFLSTKRERVKNIMMYSYEPFRKDRIIREITNFDQFLDVEDRSLFLHRIGLGLTSTIPCRGGPSTEGNGAIRDQNGSKSKHQGVQSSGSGWCASVQLIGGR